MWSSSRELDRTPPDEPDPHPRYASWEDVTIRLAGPGRERQPPWEVSSRRTHRADRARCVRHRALSVRARAPTHTAAARLANPTQREHTGCVSSPCSTRNVATGSPQRAHARSPGPGPLEIDGTGGIPESSRRELPVNAPGPRR